MYGPKHPLYGKYAKYLGIREKNMVLKYLKTMSIYCVCGWITEIMLKTDVTNQQMTKLNSINETMLKTGVRNQQIDKLNSVNEIILKTGVTNQQINKLNSANEIQQCN